MLGSSGSINKDCKMLTNMSIFHVRGMYRYFKCSHYLFSDSSLTVQEPDSSDEIIGHLSPDSSNNVQDPVSIGSEICNDLLDNSDVSSSLCGSSLENSSDDSEQNSIFSTDTSSIFSAKSSDSDESDSDIEKQSENNRALRLLSCFKKHNLTSSACTDILRTIREILPEVKSNPLLNYKKVLYQTHAKNVKLRLSLLY